MYSALLRTLTAQHTYRQKRLKEKLIIGFDLETLDMLKFTLIVDTSNGNVLASVIINLIEGKFVCGCM